MADETAAASGAPVDEAHSALLTMAHLCEQAERFQDMARFMRKLAERGVPLSSEERNLLSVAYKNYIGAPRASWRIIKSFQHKEESKRNESNALLIADYRRSIDRELQDICNEILTLLDKSLLRDDLNPDSKVFYLKMQGDYYRYNAEFAMADERRRTSEASLRAYRAASEIAENDLRPTNPIRLGLALNFSVFHFEVLNDAERACQIAKAAFDDAIGELDRIQEANVKDSTLILQLLRDNLTLWSVDDDKPDFDGDVDGVPRYDQ